MRQATLILGLTVALAGCDVPFLQRSPMEPTQPEIVAPVIETAPAEAPATPRPTSAEVVVALGDASEPGLWIKTSIVDADTPGRVVTANGRTLDVTLRPQPLESDGGAQISLAAMQALLLPLTELTPVTISVKP